MAVAKFYEDLSNDFSQFLDESDDYDVVIQAGEKSDFKEFNVHSNILRARSPYFKTALSSRWAIRKDGVIVFKKPNISPVVFFLILRYIYTGVLDLTNQSGFNILALLVASDELILNKLVDYVQKHIIDKESAWLQKNLVVVLHTVFKLQSCKTIQDDIMKTICKDPKPFFELKEFQNLDKDIFLQLVMRNDLNFDEIDIWKYLVKWGTTQSVTSRGRSKAGVTNWKDNDFASFKMSLDPFIPYIRFHEISRTDFYHHVRPYKKAIPENLYEDLVAYLMADVNPKISKLPSRYGSIKIDSIIIERDNAMVITNWIERRETFVMKPFYEFTLTYRATRDGFDYNKFIINNCAVPVLALIKISNSEKIIGGYNPLGWRNKSEYGYNYNRHYYARYECATNDSFIFCFENVKGSKAKILSRVNTPSYAIYSNDGNWMNFGGSDLIVNGQNGSCTQSYYEKMILDTDNFEVEELETFIHSRNILVHDGTMMIADFGISKEWKNQIVTTKGDTGPGVPQYMDPKYLADHKPNIQEAFDILQHLISGESIDEPGDEPGDEPECQEIQSSITELPPLNSYETRLRIMNQLNHQYLMVHIFEAIYEWKTNLTRTGVLAIAGITTNQLENPVFPFQLMNMRSSRS
ncbi:5900_t:CDS:2 [Cetraspora pellucida]|uniref:5900_t:CDS:1 n=1 Tax=Cetraspora pellucida TaxID=1433469 RepID=A0ACA9JWP1_9GLOM|nr:5900_t:CDS:2 [Cetraspora pellucida]